MTYLLDDDRCRVTAGDTVLFTYGIPPIVVRARIRHIDGVLWVMTPGHRPDSVRLRELRSMVGGFYKVCEK